MVRSWIGEEGRGIMQERRRLGGGGAPADPHTPQMTTCRL